METKEEWRTIDGWPGYMIRQDGTVLKCDENRILSHIMNAKGKPFVRLSRRTGRKAEYTRQSFLVERLLALCFPKKLAYVRPVCMDLAEPGEVFVPVRGQTDYLISNHQRVWSRKSLRFVGKRTNYGKPCVLFSDGTTKNVDKLYAEHFGYNPPIEPGEEWKESDAPGILVSNRGRLFSTYTLSIVVPRLSDSGYLLYDAKDGKRYRVHRLVAMAFVSGRDLFRDCIDHINEDKTDNRAENLRWCTIEENNDYYAMNHPYPVKISPGHRC